jgi:hypothetical protein
MSSAPPTRTRPFISNTRAVEGVGLVRERRGRHLLAARHLRTALDVARANGDWRREPPC